MRVVLAVLFVLLGPAVAAGAEPQWFPLQQPDSELTDVVGGPDGRVWFTERNTGRIGAIDGAGAVEYFAGQPADTSTGLGFGPSEIVAGGDGALYWLTDVDDSVGRIVPGGRPTLIFANDRYGMESIGAGAGDGVWLTFDHGTDSESADDGIVRLHADGRASRLPGEYSGDLLPIATGPDGAAWYGDGGSALVRITEDGQSRRFPIEPAQSLEEVSSIAFDRSGGVVFGMYKPRSGWFSGASGGSIGRVVGDRAVVTPLRDTALPKSLQLGPDGGVWFSTSAGIARTDATGVVTVAPVAGVGADGPGEMTFGADGAIWFTDAANNRLGRVDPRAPGFFPVSAGARPVFRVVGRLRAARRAKRLDVRCTLPDPGSCAVVATVSRGVAKSLRLRSRTLGRGTANGTASGEVRVPVRLGAAARRGLGRVKRRVKVTLRVTVRGPQSLSTASGPVTLRR